MPISIPLLTQGVLTASGVNSIFQNLEEFLNGGIEKTDMDTSSKWVKERHIVKPEFYGSPAPRTLMVSSDVHTRVIDDNVFTFVATNDMAQSFIPIPGLSATVYADLNQDEASTCVGIVDAVFFCLEKEGHTDNRNSYLVDTTPPSNMNSTVAEVEADAVLAATFALYVNGSEIDGTRRYLYHNYDGFAFKNHSISAIITLNHGMNNISVRVKPALDTTAFSFYQVMIRERNLQIEVIYR